MGAVNEELLQALPNLLDQRVETLRAIPGGLRADWLYALDNPDLPRRLLEWIDDPDAVKTGVGWAAFCAQAKSAYNLDPVSETPIEAARLLGEQMNDAWRAVWTRYREAPRRFPHLPDRLHAAKPPATLPMFSPADVTWPQVNEAAETELRAALTALTGAREVDARDAIETQEAAHGAWRNSVWADLERTPLANALAHLAVLARESVKPVAGGLICAGQINLGGAIDPIHTAVAVAELAVEKGAVTLLMPVAPRRQLIDLPDDMAARLNIIFYTDAQDALLNALLD